MKNELGQGVDHFKRAAALAAQETSATVGPRLNAAVDRVQPAATKARDAATSGWDSALATITPLVSAATDNVRQTGKVSKKQAKKTAKANEKQAKKLQKRANAAIGRKKSRGRGSKLLGFALLGTAVGVGAAYVSKRRQAAQWDEYEPAAPIAPVPGVVNDTAFEPTTSTLSNGTTAKGTTSNGTTSNGTASDTTGRSPR